MLVSEEQWRDHVGGKKHNTKIREWSRSAGAEAKPRTVRLSLASEPRHVVQSLGRLMMLVLTPGMDASLRRVMMCVFRFIRTVANVWIHPRMVELRLRDLSTRFLTAAPMRATACISGAVGAAEFQRVEGSGGIVAVAGELQPRPSLFFIGGANAVWRRGGHILGTVLAIAHAIAQQDK